MAQRGVPGDWDSPADRPSILAITVESTPRRRAGLRPAHVLIAVALMGAIAAAVAIAALPGSGGGSPAAPTSNPLTPGPPQPSVIVQSISPPDTAPGLYRIPPGCLRPGSTAQTPACSAHAGYAVALLRRIGAWRGTLLEPTGASCAPAPVPPLARGKVKACPR